jgi:ISXO2-like transposase domain
VSGEAHVICADELTSHPGAVKQSGLKNPEHKTVNHSQGVYVDGDITTNSIESAFSLLKRGIVGSWHKVSAKHLAAYLDEMTSRFNNRKNPYLFRDTLLRLIEAPVLEYKTLTAA